MSTWLGIDIGTDTVKACAIRTSYRKVQLVGLASVPVTEQGGVGEAIAAAGRMAVGVAGTIDAIATSIEGSKTTARILGLPQNAAKQLGDVLPFELESTLPFDLEEAVFDYRLLPGLRETKGEELAVMTTVAKTADVVGRIDLIKSTMGLEPERVGVGAFPIANGVPYWPALAEDVIAVVELGATLSDVLILQRGEPIFSRTVGVGTAGLPGSASKLARELRTTIAAHRSQGGESPVRVFLCGDGAYVGGAAAFLASALELPVDLLPPPTMEMAPLAPELAARMAAFAKAIGLAIGLGPRPVGPNLRRGPLAFERGFAWVKEKIPLLAGLGAVIVVSFLFSTWAQLYAKGKEKAVLESALAAVTKDVLGEETSDAARANELLSQQTAVNDEDPLPHADGFDVMVRLSELIPPSMTHDIEELDLQKGHVIVHGIVGSIPDAEAIRAAMATEKCFADPKITRTNAQVGSTSQKYVLEFDVKCPVDQKGAKKGASSAQAAPTTSGAAGGK